jgi:hypothetical protein
MRKGTAKERALVWCVGIFTYAVVYLYTDSLIPITNNSVPLQWVPVIIGAVCAVGAIILTVEVLLSPKRVK